MSEPSPEQSFSIHLKSLTDFADEFTTQIQSLQAPMDHLATMSGTPPQYGAFHEAWSLGAGEQAAVEEMHTLLGQVKQAIAFAGDVTGTVADGYRNADESIAWGLGGPPANNYGGRHNDHNWSNDYQYGDPNQQDQYTDPTQNNQDNGDQVYATPVSDPTDPGPWVPNQNTSGPFQAAPIAAAVPIAGALLGGALLAGNATSKSHPANRSGQSSAKDSAGTGFDADFGSGPSVPGGPLPLWTPPPDPGPAAPPPAFPDQDAAWTATFPGGS